MHMLRVCPKHTYQKPDSYHASLMLVHEFAGLAYRKLLANLNLLILEGIYALGLQERQT